MAVDQLRINELVLRPTEALNVELKRWLDPSSIEGRAKIAKAALAMRNRNGGFLVFGFDNVTKKPHPDNRPPNVRLAFDIDVIQRIVSKYASELFEVQVAFGEREDDEYPVIVIPDGVTAPVAAKADLTDGTKFLIRAGDVYFRSLQSNGTPSSTLARPSDWRDIVDVCFENREADFGRFLRRHLPGVDSSALGRDPRSPTLRDQAVAFLAQGEQRFRQLIREKPLSPEASTVVPALTWHVALVVDPPKLGTLPDQRFQRTLASSNPELTGWPVWFDSSTFSDPSSRPYVSENGLETLVVSLAGWSKHLDFMRIEPAGKFYLRRVLPDDLNENQVKPGTAVDPILVVLRVAEALIVGLSFVKALGWDVSNTKLGFAFRWTGLTGRQLTAWANFLHSIGHSSPAHDPEITTFVELPLDTPVSAVTPYVSEGVRGLFIAFGGYIFPDTAVEQWVQKLITRSLM